MNFGTPKKPVEPQGFDNSKLYLWVKGLESKANNLRREVDVLKTDFIKRNNKLTQELKTTNSDLLEMKHKQEKSLQKMDLVIKELKQTAGKEELMTIKKYIEFWNPLNFVTQKDLDRAIESKLGLKVKEKNKKDKKIR